MRGYLNMKSMSNYPKQELIKKEESASDEQQEDSCRSEYEEEESQEEEENQVAKIDDSDSSSLFQVLSPHWTVDCGPILNTKKITGSGTMGHQGMRWGKIKIFLQKHRFRRS